ncbi:tetratricopeptide repeat protein [Helicobacter cynogastricus]|uniref:tetratricopeptide repeat protein n=1 Tax=Helicobacter cynogastricus TaxID=329937 RepID=UPI000CF1B6BF|nr:tetratricopeptide repeat protein [Helicobacter cynogastricus]
MLEVRACQVLLGVLLGFSVAYANPKADEYLSVAKEAYRYKDYAKALENYQKAAELGSADAYRGLANMYMIGAGMPKDHKQARIYFQKAMDLRHAQRKDSKPSVEPQASQTQLTQAQQAQKPQVTEAKSAPKAVLAGAQAYMRLGKDYANGQGGMSLDFKKATEAFEKAGQMGEEQGYNAIGDLYYNDGKGVEQDYKKAFEYYQKAAQMGQPKDFRLGVMYYNGQGVSRDYSKAVEYFEAGAKKGDGWSCDFLGWMYHNGKGVSLNYQKAREYYRQAVQNFLKAGSEGNAKAYVFLGNMYRDGDGVPQDYQKAMEYYQGAMRLKSGNGTYNWASMLANNSADYEQIKVAYQQAIKFYQEEGKNGDANAYAMLGSIYKSGVFIHRTYVKRDYAQALEYYQKAAEMGNGESYYQIGEMYANGQGVQYNRDKARGHWQIACSMGYKKACK